MAFENDDQAAEALFDAVQSDRAETGDAPSRREADPPENKPDVTPDGSAQEQPTGQPATPDPADSFTGIDPNALPDELKPLYNSMLRDYRSKTEQVAEERKRFEALDQFGGIDAAAEAVQFVTSLATDPEYALNVHEQLTQALVQAGMTPGQASREAARQIDDAIDQAPAPTDDDFGLGIDPAAEQKLSALERKLEDIDRWRQQEEESRLQYAMMGEMDRMHADVVNQYKFNDDQMSRVYAIAYSTGGDLRSAAEVYNAMRDQIISEYVTAKASVPAPPTLPATGGGEQPRKFSSLLDPELEKLVNQRLAHEAAQGNL